MTATITATYVLKAGGLFAVVMAIVFARRTLHPVRRLGPANTTTAVRALLTALDAGFIGSTPLPPAGLVIAIGTAAALLDGVDGWLARRTHMASAFGARFDVEVDALLILVLAALAWDYDKAGSWVLASGLLRYAFVAAGCVWPWMRNPLTPTVRAKVVCAAQMAALLIALLPAVTPPASGLVAAGALAALIYSFGADTLRLWRSR